MLVVLIKLLFSILIYVSIVVLTYSLFKISIIKNHKQIAIISAIAGTVHYYTRFEMKSSIFFIIMLFTYMFLIMAARGYPIFYAFVVSFTGEFASALIDETTTMAVISLKLSTLEEMLTLSFDYVIMHLITSGFIFGVSFILRKYDLGFNFVKRRFSGTAIILKPYNFIWSLLILITVFLLQMNLIEFDYRSYRFYYMAGIILLILIVLVYTYYQNIKVVKDIESGGNHGINKTNRL